MREKLFKPVRYVRLCLATALFGIVGLPAQSYALQAEVSVILRPNGAVERGDPLRFEDSTGNGGTYTSYHFTKPDALVVAGEEVQEDCEERGYSTGRLTSSDCDDYLFVLIKCEGQYTCE